MNQSENYHNPFPTHHHLSSAPAIRKRMTDMFFKPVPHEMKVVIDDYRARQYFNDTAINPFVEHLTQGEAGYYARLTDIYFASALTALNNMTTNIPTFIENCISYLDLTETVFSDQILSNPLMRNNLYEATKALAMHIYFELRRFDLLSDENTYVLEMIGPNFLMVGIYPETQINLHP